MNYTIVLPRVVGTRPAAQYYLDSVPERLHGKDVELDCSGLADGTASFADEIVKVVLADRGARSLVAVAPGHDFATDLQTAAHDHGVADRFRLERVIESVGS